MGVTSAKIRITKVSTAGSNQTIAHSPMMRVVRAVATVVAIILTKLLPMRMTPISLSGRRNSLEARIAPRFFFFTKCFRRYRLSESIPVSALEKKPERRIKNAKIAKSRVVEGPSNGGLTYVFSERMIVERVLGSIQGKL